jgi:thymidylate synthase (FAD)
MAVRLICYSQPTAEFLSETGSKDLKDLIAYMARVSNPTNQNNTETSDRLLKYLVNNKHWSPLEMVHATVEITTTRDIARQILRHRSFSFQEFSQRYANPTDMEYGLREARLQDAKNRQNSIETKDKELTAVWDNFQEIVMMEAKSAYNWAIANGIAKEQARVVLPEGLTTSKMYMAGSMRSWVHYCQLRAEEGTQKEHRIIAQECAAALQPVFKNMFDLIAQ